jgi:hypothetical protein
MAKKNFAPTGNRTPVLPSTPQPSYHIEIDSKESSDFLAGKIGDPFIVESQLVWIGSRATV